MKNYLSIIIVLFFISACSMFMEGETIKSVTFKTSIHCQDCVDTVFNNLPREKGVVDLKIELDTKLVTVFYNENETGINKLVEYLNNLGYTAFVVTQEKNNGAE